MNKILILLLFFLTIQGYAQTDSSNNPFKANSSKSEQHFRIKKTRIFINLPEDYYSTSDFGKQFYFRKDKKLFLVFYETNLVSFEENKNLLFENFSKNENNYLEEFIFFGFPAIFFREYNPSTKTISEIVLFGNHNFSAQIDGVVSSDDINDKNELVKILNSIFYDENYNLNQLEEANFTINNQLIGFNYISQIDYNWYLINERGIQDRDNQIANKILISNAKPLKNNTDLVQMAEGLLKYSKAEDMEILQKECIEQKIGNYDSVIINSRISFHGKEGLLYLVVLSNGSQVLAFNGNAFENLQETRKKFQEVVETIQFK